VVKLLKCFIKKNLVRRVVGLWGGKYLYSGKIWRLKVNYHEIIDGSGYRVMWG
jgi:hypothetical protein